MGRGDYYSVNASGYYSLDAFGRPPQYPATSAQPSGPQEWRRLLYDAGTLGSEP